MINVQKSLGLAALVMTLAGCGWFIDKDRIVVAKIGEREITRGELSRVIREMPDDERPIVRSRGDLQRTLETYVDEQIRGNLAEELEKEGKLTFPREISAAEFDAKHPEFRGAEAMESAAEDYKLSPQQINIMRDERESGIDRIQKRNLGRAAVILRAQEAVQNKTLTVTPEELEEEYRLRGADFKTLEVLIFLAIQFPGDEAAARAEAAKVIQRVQAGEAFEAIAQEYRSRNPDLVFESAIQNDPRLEKFQGFWLQASGAEVGQVLGPVYLPPSERVDQATGAVSRIGGSVVVLKVIQHTPERQKSIEEAANELGLPILEAKMMEALRKEYRVEFYPEKLPDPSFADDQGPPIS